MIGTGSHLLLVDAHYIVGQRIELRNLQNQKGWKEIMIGHSSKIWWRTCFYCFFSVENLILIRGGGDRIFETIKDNLILQRYTHSFLMITTEKGTKQNLEKL